MILYSDPVCATLQVLAAKRGTEGRAQGSAHSHAKALDLDDGEVKYAAYLKEWARTEDSRAALEAAFPAQLAEQQVQHPWLDLALA